MPIPISTSWNWTANSWRPFNFKEWFQSCSLFQCIACSLGKTLSIFSIDCRLVVIRRRFRTVVFLLTISSWLLCIRRVSRNCCQRHGHAWKSWGGIQPCGRGLKGDPVTTNVSLSTFTGGDLKVQEQQRQPLSSLRRTRDLKKVAFEAKTQLNCQDLMMAGLELFVMCTAKDELLHFLARNVWDMVTRHNSDQKSNSSWKRTVKAMCSGWLWLLNSWKKWLNCNDQCKSLALLVDECSGQGQLAIGFYAAKALFICLPYFSEDAQRLLSHAAQVATACASTLRAEFAAVDRPGLTALQQLVGVAWSGLADLCDGFWEFLACISMRMATLGCNVVLCQKMSKI